MTDLFDQATYREEIERELSIKVARMRGEELPAVGRCHWCDEIVPEGHKFCDSDCRDGWQRDKKLRERR